MRRHRSSISQLHSAVLKHSFSPVLLTLNVRSLKSSVSKSCKRLTTTVRKRWISKNRYLLSWARLQVTCWTMTNWSKCCKIRRRQPMKLTSKLHKHNRQKQVSTRHVRTTCQSQRVVRTSTSWSLIWQWWATCTRHLWRTSWSCSTTRSWRHLSHQLHRSVSNRSRSTWRWRSSSSSHVVSSRRTVCCSHSTCAWRSTWRTERSLNKSSCASSVPVQHLIA